MKKFFTTLLLCICALTLNAQSNTIVYPVSAFMQDDTTAVATSNTFLFVEKLHVGRANGENIKITITQDGKTIKTITSASKDTRFVKGAGYAALYTSNFTYVELRQRNREWYADLRTRNRFGSGKPLY